MQALEELCEARVLLGLHGEDTDDRAEDAQARQGHRGHSELDAQGTRFSTTGQGHRRSGTKGHGREDRAVVRLVEVGTHTGNITDIITDIVGDGRGVTRVVFRDTGFDLTNKVGTNIGGLGVDTTTDACEQRLRRCTHAEAQHDGGDLSDPAANQIELVEDEEPGRDVDEREAHHIQAHDRTGAERNGEAFIE